MGLASQNEKALKINSLQALKKGCCIKNLDWLVGGIYLFYFGMLQHSNF